MRQEHAISLLLIALACGCVFSEAAQDKNPPVVEVTDEVKERQDEFLKLKFGMFLCYNMATYKKTNWVEGYPSPADFNPGVETIDTDAWADAAVSAGMKYGVLTVKHVGGFCLWDSKYTTYDVMHPDCPYKKDIVEQFVKSFKSRGLKVGFYYCWRHPRFDSKGRNGKFKVLPPECDPAKHSLEEQIEFQKKQIAELVEKFPDVFYIWNDALDTEIMSAEETKAFYKSINPEILTSANWMERKKKGRPYVDIAVTEKFHFPAGNKYPAETCWTLDDPRWFCTGNSGNSTAKQIIDHMKTANGRNANFLLNVGPNQKGDIITSSIAKLAAIGKLLQAEDKSSE